MGGVAAQKTGQSGAQTIELEGGYSVAFFAAPSGYPLHNICDNGLSNSTI